MSFSENIRVCCDCNQPLYDDVQPRIHVGHLMYDDALKIVTWKGKPVKLTRRLITVLRQIMTTHPRAINRVAIEFVSFFDCVDARKSVDVAIHQIRRAFLDVDPATKGLFAAPTRGYIAIDRSIVGDVVDRDAEPVELLCEAA